MNEEIKKNVMSDVSTAEKKLESIVFNTLHSKIRGHIFVKMKEQSENEDENILSVSISNNRYNIVYNDDVRLPGDSFEMASQSDSYAEMVGLMIYDNYKKYLDSKFYVQDRPKRVINKYKKTEE